MLKGILPKWGKRHGHPTTLIYEGTKPSIQLSSPKVFPVSPGSKLESSRIDLLQRKMLCTPFKWCSDALMYWSTALMYSTDALLYWCNALMYSTDILQWCTDVLMQCPGALMFKSSDALMYRCNDVPKHSHWSWGYCHQPHFECSHNLSMHSHCMIHLPYSWVF